MSFDGDTERSPDAARSRVHQPYLTHAAAPIPSTITTKPATGLKSKVTKPNTIAAKVTGVTTGGDRPAAAKAGGRLVGDLPAAVGTVISGMTRSRRAVEGGVGHVSPWMVGLVFSYIICNKPGHCYFARKNGDNKITRRC